MSDDMDLIRLAEAARMLDRKPDTLRRWIYRKRAPTGARLRVYRDQLTTNYYVERKQVVEIRASLRPSEE